MRTLRAQGFSGNSERAMMALISIQERRIMLTPLSTLAALRPAAIHLNHVVPTELLRAFAKDPVWIRILVLSILTLAQLTMGFFVLSARLAVVLALVLITTPSLPW